MPGLVLVHGVAPGGPADPRIKGMAIALNRLGRTVIAPSLGLGEQRLDRPDPARIRQAIDYLSDKTGEKVIGAGVFIRCRLHAGGVRGGPFDPGQGARACHRRHLLRPRAPAPGGDRGPGRAARAARPRSGGPTRGRERRSPSSWPTTWRKPERAPLLEAYESRTPEGLSDGARAIYDLMVNTDPSRTRELVEQASGRARAR